MRPWTFTPVRAAMEPALDERGDCGTPCPAHTRDGCRNGARSRRAGRPASGDDHAVLGAAAMEPALDERGDLLDRVQIRDVIGRPQWSPLSTSGATRHPRWRRPVDICAAMEPALDERGDPAQVRRRPGVRNAAMEPALDERGDQEKMPAGFNGFGAAMEPALDERGDLTSESRSSSS